MTTPRETSAAIAVLLQEHDACRAQIEQTERALASSRLGDTTSHERALALARDLLRYLETALETHIAKEEGPLFPRLKAALPASDRLIDEMVAEHDLIRMKRDDVQAVLLELLGGHDDLRAERQGLRSALADRTGRATVLTQLTAAVATVATKLRVHFENEEELVFPLAPDLLSEEDLTATMEEMTAIGETEVWS